MRRYALAAMLLAVVFLSSYARGQETPAESRIVKIGLFKNGLAVVKRSVQLPGAGRYLVSDVPEPVHGTFWIESDAQLKVTATTRLIEVPLRNSAGIDLQEALVGAKVTVHLRDGAPAASGVVEDIAPVETGESVGQALEWLQLHYQGNWGATPAQRRFLVLRTDKGRVFVEASAIVSVEQDGSEWALRQARPALVIETPGVASVTMMCLQKGISWAPGYRVDMTDGKELVVSQSAIIKNELADIADAETTLISGFPNVPFAGVVSPLSTTTGWDRFFRQLNQRFTPGGVGQAAVMSQQVIMSNIAPQSASAEPEAAPSGEGVDLHYQDAGRLTLKRGDAMVMPVGTAKAAYERVVEWVIPDTRDANGRYIQEWERARNAEKYEDSAWDAVKFRNPLEFPMTTAPAMVVAGDAFNGQGIIYWTDKGEETVLRVTKALSIRTMHSEIEVPGERELVYVWGNDFRKVSVEGQLTVSNHRGEAVKAIARRQFSGELIQAEGSPKSALREEGVYSVNKRNELTWSIELAPGETRSFKYKYAVLVDN